MNSKNPDFIICGAPRAGTTWLVRALEEHPDIYMAKPTVPEPKFFHIDSIYEKGMQYYRDTWFAGVPDGMTAGEKDTYYLENPDAAARIRADLPDVKLIFILREPGVRAWSNYRWSVHHGHEKETFMRALELEEEREAALPEALRFVRPHAYFSRGLYADLLGPYLERFPLDNMLFLNFNGIATDGEALLASTHEFLGVAPRPQDCGGLGDVNPTPGQKETIPAREREWLDARYAKPNAALRELLGDRFTLWDVPL